MKVTLHRSVNRSGWKHIVSAAALLISGLLLHGTAAAAQAGSQQRITLQMKQATVEQVLQGISETTNHKFLYRVEDLSATERRDYTFNNASVEQVMNDLTGGTALVWNNDNGTIVISRVARQQPPAAQTRTVTGRVIDENGEPLVGVTVVMQGQNQTGTTTGGDGRYTLTLPANAQALAFSYIGMDPQTIALRQDVNVYDVTLNTSVTQLKSATVNAGIMTRHAATFTGSARTVTQAELKQAGTINVLSAMSSIDPSFMIVANNLAGSDPNAVMNIEINGKTSMDFRSLSDESSASANPNQPLFVLDGFETTIEKIMDMDINRIESITLLKDAGSTAIYGAKGANGVIVVETVKPKAGELMVNYSLNLQTAFPDLSVYNLMNAREKLEFEKLAGVYNNYTGSLTWDNPMTTGVYWYRYADVQRGVDTYWLKYPVRTGITHTHHVDIQGGSEEFVYMAHADYSSEQGVMKGSSRENFSGGIFLQYRRGRLNISNDMTFGTTNRHSGSYGSFTNWANASPYFKPYDEEGKLVMNLNPLSSLGGSGAGSWYSNPLYNAYLDSDNTGKSSDFQNNTRFEYTLPDIGLRIIGGLGLTRLSSVSESIKDPRHTDFRDRIAEEKGDYSYSSGYTWEWSGNLAASFTRMIADDHQISAVVRAQANHQNSVSSGYTVRGFPEGAKPNPSMGGFPPNATPTFRDEISRGVELVATMNYNYMAKYLLDLTVQYDGSTTFGKDNPFTTNWSVGVGWNVFEEKFADNWQWADNMKLRGSIGTNANQNKKIVPQNIYNYMAGSAYFGQAWVFDKFANPYVKWEKVRNTTVGLDLTLIDNRLNATFDVYEKMTDPMVISLPFRPSTGTDGYDTNMGYTRTLGWTANVSYVILRRPEDMMLFSVSLMAGHNKQNYGGVGEAFDELNKQFAESLNIDLTNDGDSSTNWEAVAELAENIKNNTNLRRYYDGADADALWAVRSLGIDPATGREIFLTKDGKPTFVYNADDRVEVGSERADIFGALNLRFNYKHLRMNFTFGYSLGGYTFNRALFTKVENITGTTVLNNQDRRALYERWQNPGDISQFRSIALGTDSQMTDRFIQKNNYFESRAIMLTWDFYGSRLLDKSGLKSLQASVSLENMFRLSSIEMERGLDFPFNRSITFKLTTSF